jgi:hypothetical protein
MNCLWTDINEYSSIEEYTSPTSDVLLGELRELPSGFCIPWRPSDFTGWPIISVAESLEAPREFDPIEPAPFSPDERNLGQSQMFLVFSFLYKQSDHFFVRFGDRATTSPYTLVQSHVELPLHRTRFRPDFFNIKKFVTYIMGRIPVSATRQQQLPKIKQSVPTTVSPQVIIESEEKKLTEDLESAVKIAEEAYSTLKAIDINIENDPEIAGRSRIQFTLTVSGEPDLVLKDEFKFKESLYTVLDPQTCEQITTTYRWKN